MRDYAERVKALRCCSKIDARNNGCDSCPYEYCGDDCQNLCGYAADAIEELQEENRLLKISVELQSRIIRSMETVVKANGIQISTKDGARMAELPKEVEVKDALP